MANNDPATLTREAHRAQMAHRELTSRRGVSSQQMRSSRLHVATLQRKAEVAHREAAQTTSGTQRQRHLSMASTHKRVARGHEQGGTRRGELIERTPKKKAKKKAPGTVMTGKKGGKYMVSKSGKKIYVGRKGGR